MLTLYLTGLPNARSLFVHLQKEVERCRFLKLPLSVLVCDLEGFKQINDRFGHLEGNKLLSSIARGLRDCCRREDYVARLGGDEFVIVMPETKPEDMPAKLRQFTQLTVRAGRRISGEDLLSMSVGQAFYPGCGTTPEQLLTEADLGRCFKPSDVIKRCCSDRWNGRSWRLTRWQSAVCIPR